MFNRKSIIAGVAAAALCASSTSALAAKPAPLPSPATLSPLVALSAFAGQSSAAALCSGTAAVAASGAAVAAQAGPGQPGCILPVVEPAPVPVAEVAPPVTPVVPAAVAATDFGAAGIFAALIGAGLAAAILAIVLDGERNDDEEVSPA